MLRSKKTAASLMAAAFALGAIWLLVQGHLVSSGTLFVFCSFSIYLREKAKQQALRSEPQDAGTDN